MLRAAEHLFLDLFVQKDEVIGETAHTDDDIPRVLRVFQSCPQPGRIQHIDLELGVPETVVALLFVALGTSLPELVTTITSLKKGRASLGVGNVIGANVFNLVLVSGVAVSLAPFDVPAESILRGTVLNMSKVVDIPVMLTVMLLMTVPALVRKKLSRPQGIALLCIYAAFCVIQFTM